MVWALLVVLALLFLLRGPIHHIQSCLLPFTLAVLVQPTWSAWRLMWL